MAYCRWGKDSDVYMYYGGGYMFHLGWQVKDETSTSDFSVATAEEALHRLKRIKTQGYKVPDYAIERLEQEIKDQNDSS